jgi:hypothetical protein
MVTARFPDPHQLRRFRGKPGEEIEGVARARVTIPDSLDPPPLPHRRSYDGRLVFPVGIIDGTWSLLELREAERLGCAVEWLDGIGAPSIKSPFIEYVKDQYERKRKAVGLARDIAKLMLNALYGKFGEYHSQGEEYSEGFSEDRLNWLKTERFKLAGDETAEQKDAVLKLRETVTWKPVSKDRADGYYSFAAAEGGIATHSIYSWAVQITAMARIINLRTQLALKAAGIRVLYTDTDSFLADHSIITNAPALSDMIGDQLGQMKLEKKTITEIFGAKDYATNEGHTLKGVRKTAERGEDGLYRFPAIMTAKEAIRRGNGHLAGEQKLVVKRGHSTYDKRIVGKDGWTKPVKVPFDTDYFVGAVNANAFYSAENRVEMRVVRAQDKADRLGFTGDYDNRVKYRRKNRVASWARTLGDDNQGV